MSGKGHEAAFPAGWVGDAHTVLHLTDPMEGIKHIAALAREHTAPTGSRQVASVGLPSLAWPQELVPRPGHAPAGEAPAGRQAPKATSLHPRNPRPQGTGGEARGLSILKTLRKQVPCVSFLAHPNGLRGLKMGQSSHTALPRPYPGRCSWVLLGSSWKHPLKSTSVGHCPPSRPTLGLNSRAPSPSQKELDVPQ